MKLLFACFILSSAAGCAGIRRADPPAIVDASVPAEGGIATQSPWQLVPSDFAQPWIRLSVPMDSGESLMSLIRDPHGFVALVRKETGAGKVIGPISHRLATSADGINWSSWLLDEQTDLSQERRQFEALAYWNGLYVAVGYGWTPLIWTSADATHWTQISAGGWELFFATFAGNRWFAGGALGDLLTSLDGVTWRTQRLVEASLNDVAYGNGTYVAAGNRAFWIASDGVTFDPITINCESSVNCPGVWPPGSTFPLAAMIAVERIFFAQGTFYGLGSAGFNYSSTDDGRSWNAFPSDLPFPWMFLGGRFLSISTGGVVDESIDGVNWSLRTQLTDDNPTGVSCATERCFVWKSNIVLVPSS